MCQLIYCRSLLLAVKSVVFDNKIKIAHVFQFVKFPVMENRENDAAGKEHRPEIPPFLTNERDNTGRPYSRNKDFLEKSHKSQDARLQSQDSSHKTQDAR